MSLVSERVQKGIELLDLKNEGWRERIRLSSLSLASFVNCVLGQLYGGFSIGCDKLDIAPGDAYLYGFDIDSDGDYGFPDVDVEWHAQLQN